MSLQQTQRENRQLMFKLVVVASLMFAFAMWIMPPLYNLFCEVTGLNGKTGGRYEAVSADVDLRRKVTVQFLTANNESMPWYFQPETQSLVVHPGQEVTVNFLASNPTSRDMVAQAIPSLVPFKAAAYFHKTECFCFNQQHLVAGAQAKLPVRFIIDQDIPDQVHTITLSYTLFDVSNSVAGLNVTQ